MIRVLAIATALAILTGCATAGPGASIDGRHRVASLNHAYGAAFIVSGLLATAGTAAGYLAAQSANEGTSTKIEPGPFLASGGVGLLFLVIGGALVGAGDAGFDGDGDGPSTKADGSRRRVDPCPAGRRDCGGFCVAVTRSCAAPAPEPVDLSRRPRQLGNDCTANERECGTWCYASGVPTPCDTTATSTVGR